MIPVAALAAPFSDTQVYAVAAAYRRDLGAEARYSYAKTRAGIRSIRRARLAFLRREVGRRPDGADRDRIRDLVATLEAEARARGLEP